jgi:hypothetical protein
MWIEFYSPAKFYVDDVSCFLNFSRHSELKIWENNLLFQNIFRHNAKILRRWHKQKKSLFFFSPTFTQFLTPKLNLHYTNSDENFRQIRICQFHLFLFYFIKLTTRWRFAFLSVWVGMSRYEAIYVKLSRIPKPSSWHSIGKFVSSVRCSQLVVI